MFLFLFFGWFSLHRIPIWLPRNQFSLHNMWHAFLGLNDASCSCLSCRFFSWCPLFLNLTVCLERSQVLFVINGICYFLTSTCESIEVGPAVRHAFWEKQLKKRTKVDYRSQDFATYDSIDWNFKRTYSRYNLVIGHCIILVWNKLTVDFTHGPLFRHLIKANWGSWNSFLDGCGDYIRNNVIKFIVCFLPLRA